MTEQSFWMPLAAGFVAASVTGAGIMAIRQYEEWALKNAMYFSAFAAGVLISVSFLHIVPKSIELYAGAPVFLLVGYFAMHLLNRFVSAYVCDWPATAKYAIGLVPLIGISVHSFIDGIIYSVTFTISTATGFLAAIGMILHEFPEGVFTYVLLLKSGIAEKRALLLALLGASLTTPLGVLVSFPFIALIEPSTIAAMLALSAGALIYVGATHLLPSAEREAGQYSILALMSGMLVAVGIVITHG